VSANLEAAVAYAMSGMPVLPLTWPKDGACSCGDPKCSSVAKHPLTEHGKDDASTDPEMITRWWTRWPKANIGLRMGNGRVAIDVDPRHGGDESLHDLGPLPETVTSLTGGNGQHLLYKTDGPIKGRKGIRPGVDMVVDGYIVAPPSRHISGRMYAWEIDHAPGQIALAPLPPVLLELARNGRTPGEPIPDSIVEGTRNALLTSIAGSMRRRGASPEAIEAALEVENATRCEPPLDPSEVRQIAQSVGRYGPAAPKDAEHLTDLGNARRFAGQHGENLRYCAPRGKWLVWTAVRWEEDRTGIVLRLARETVASIYIEAAHASDHKPLATHAMKSESEARLKAMVSLAESEPDVPILPEQLDADPWILNVLNGTIDLRTGNLLPHRREDYITKLAPVEYDDDAPCPLWLGFLERIFDRKQALIDYVQRAVGYSMTGSTREQCWFLGYGRGQNGKTTLRETVKAMLGDYGAVTETRTFLQERYEGVRNDLARLPGVRYLTCMETESGKKLAEGLVKLVTGGDTISARFLFHESFEFKPVFKLWLSANHKPRITGTDYATWRRIRLLDFSVTIPEEERDPDLLEKLQQELPGILAWAVQGCRDWQRHGLGTPEEVAQATENFRIEQDTLGAFIAECCEADADAYVAASAIYHAFSEWCREQGEKPLRKTEFGTRLNEKGYAPDRKHSIGRCWLGLRLNGLGGVTRDVP